MPLRREPGKWLRKKAKAGAGAHPIGTVAFYGPDDRRASKVVAAVIRAEGEDAAELRRWFDDEGDIRRRGDLLEEISEFFRAHGVRSIAMVNGLLGCPHEEGIDYPEGENCPLCPYWAGRDRFTGKML
jgi:hypothetical protein